MYFKENMKQNAKNYVKSFKLKLNTISKKKNEWISYLGLPSYVYSIEIT